VAVSNVHTPAPVLVFWLLPTVSRMYGPPNGVEPPSSWYVFADRPKISVSRSVNGAASSHVVSARNCVPCGGALPTS
jgi:hypothetical protein